MLKFFLIGPFVGYAILELYQPAYPHNLLEDLILLMGWMLVLGLPMALFFLFTNRLLNKVLKGFKEV